MFVRLSLLRSASGSSVGKSNTTMVWRLDVPIPAQPSDPLSSGPAAALSLSADGVVRIVRTTELASSSNAAGAGAGGATDVETLLWASSKKCNTIQTSDGGSQKAALLKIDSDRAVPVVVCGDGSTLEITTTSE